MMNEKKDKSYKKNLEPTAKFIHDLCEQQEVTISGIVSAKKEGQCSFNFDAGLMEVTLSTDNTDESIEEIETSRNGSDTANPLRVKSDSGCYVATTAYRSLTGLSCNSVFREKLLFSLPQLMSSEWNSKEKYYYRFLVPRPPEMLIWNSIQTDSSYSTPDNDRPDNLVKIFLEKERQIHVFLSGVKFDQNKRLEYLTIESQAPCTYTEMHEYMYAISLSLGLVTTIAPFDYAFVIASEIPDFGGKIMGGMIKLRPTIKVQYKQQFETPIKIKEDEFAKLVLMLHGNEALARAAMIVLDTPANFEYMGALYSLVLETICSALPLKENEPYLEPSGDDWKKVKSKLLETISIFCVPNQAEVLITEDHRSTIEKKLDGLNFRTNGDKLIAPFKLINYELTNEEKKIIRSRNIFLHGKSSKKKKNESHDGSLREMFPGVSFDEYQKLKNLSMELRRLCMVILFRYAGIKEPLFITYEEKTESPQPTKKPETSV
jgi:hypothetical protein